MSEVLKLNVNRRRKEVSQNGTESVAEFLDSLHKGVRFTWLEWHEAKHAVVAIAMGTGAAEASNVAEGNSGGHVLLKSKNLIAFAASHDMPGNIYDRMFVEAHGENFEALGGIADAIVAENIQLARAIARALVVERTLNETRLNQLEDQVKNGGTVKINLTTRDGRKFTFEMRAHDGQDITVEIPLFEEEKNGSATDTASKRKYTPAIFLPMFEEEPITEGTFAQDLRKAA